MNPLTLLPLLAAAMAAPGVVLSPAGTILAQQYAVPLTRTVHYESRPVVTGYQSTILKPALASAPLALSGIAIARQIPDLPTNPAPPADVPAPVPNNTTPQPPIGDAPTVPSIPGQGGNENGTGSDSPIPAVPGIPGGVVVLNNANPQLLSVVPQTVALRSAADAYVLDARALPVAAVRAAQAGDFEPLVTKQRVLAPVRTHTQITPQLTQIQPEITVRRVIQDVPYAAPVAVQPLVQQLLV